MGIRIRTTENYKKYWKERKIDWKEAYLKTWNHPHRNLIIAALKQFHWISLWEAGCGPGANLVKIIKELPGKQLGGSDINEDAIKLARETFKEGRFHVESIEDMLLSDSSTDVVLSDAALIYIGPTYIKKVIQQFTNIARSRIILCEFHSNNWWERWIYRIKSGQNVYNYQSLLEEEGCYDIQKIKIPNEYWGKSEGWNRFGYIIIAKVLKKI